MTEGRKGVSWKRVEGHGMVRLWPGEVLLFIDGVYSGKVKMRATNDGIINWMDSVMTMQYKAELSEPENEVFV